LQVSLAAQDLRVVATPCLGRCELAPAALVHQRALAQATLESVRAAIERGDRSPEPIEPAVGTGGNEGVRVYAVLAECLAGTRSAEQVMTTLEASGLRGLGGAGFPAGLKWRAVRAAASPRLMAVNIDEGEPGTFKDRFHLERNTKRFLEGLLIAAWATEIDNVFIFLRDEYHAGRALLERELAALRASPPMPALPMIELRRGAGAYVCGEESAMFESIEGKRGLPRWRPPHAAERGLFGLPTLVHNFETLVWVPEVLQRGADDFATAGRRGCKGLRSFSVSGRVRQPGVKIAPAGITLNELLAEHCGGLPDGHRLYAWLPGGASGGIMPASLADVPLDFGTLEPHGGAIGTAAVVVLSESDTHRDRAVDAARKLMAFFATESCGQCTPCRSGTARMLDLVRTEHWDRALLADLSLVMREASICGLGRAAPNPVDCVLRHFSHELT
jgi:formate dehydrogenase